jgi:pyridoxamine 5'-phosphate oxidase
MNQKNSLGLDNCFKDLENPIELFDEWFNEAKKTEINDPNALALATSTKDGEPSVRMVLLKDFNQNGFVIYTNLDSKKSTDIKNNPNASMCFHWKSILRQVRITGKIIKVSNKDADIYFQSRDYESRIGAWASKQSSVLKNREELYQEIESYKKKYSDKNNVPRPSNWSGWNLNPNEIEFWLDGKNRIHQRLKYIKKQNGNWNRSLLSP